ncbi:MAG TPA: hypothetical protein PKA64_08790, partial [Myxococcota bacterium]|nr:hypothetical protein [Myxococcota bacterium]
MDLFAWGSGGGRSWAWALPCALCACAAAGALVITAPLRMVGTSTFFALWLVPAALGALRRGPTAAGLCLAWPLLGLPLVSVAMSEIDASFRLVA